MANPFDDVLDADKPKKQQEAPPQKTTGMKPDKPKKKEQVQISFTLDKRMLERGIFILVIIVLGMMVFFNPFCSKGCSEENLTGAVIAEEKGEGQVQETAAEPEPAEKPSPVEEVKAEPAVEKEPETEKSFSSNFKFAIEDINYARCEETSDDCEDPERPSKMKSITFSMDNDWKEFVPKVIVYWYDDANQDVFKDKVRSEKIYSAIKVGQNLKYTILDFKSTFFDPTNKAENVVLKLYNADNDMLMKTLTVTIS